MSDKRRTVAKDWQLAVLKKLQSESGNPTEEQRLAAAVETGLDEKWVRNWFARQRYAARNKKDTRTRTVTVPTFKLQLHCHQPFANVSSPARPRSQQSTAVHSEKLTTSPPPTYSRDPLCNRYPDFSQFFRPQAHERSHAFELSIQSSAKQNMDPSALMHFQSLSAFPSCPVAFSMRLVDLVRRP